MTFIKLINKSHNTALTILKAVKKNPAKNLNSLSKIVKLPDSRLSIYMDAFDNFGWIKKEHHGQQNFHFITDKGCIAAICLEFLVTEKLPVGVEIVEEEE